MPINARLRGVSLGSFGSNIHRNVRGLEEAIARYVESTNAHAKAVVCTRTSEDVLPSPRRLGALPSSSGHGSTFSHKHETPIEMADSREELKIVKSFV